MHGLDSNIACLRRWGTLSEKPMPQIWAAFKKDNMEEAMFIEKRDPELVSLLAGTASANLRADCLAGKLSPLSPDPQVVASEEKKQRLQELVAMKPYEGGRMTNFTAAMQIEQLDPALGARLRKEANYLSPDERQMQESQEKKSRQDWLDSACAEGVLKTLQRKGGRY